MAKTKIRGDGVCLGKNFYVDKAIYSHRKIRDDSEIKIPSSEEVKTNVLNAHSMGDGC